MPKDNVSLFPAVLKHWRTLRGLSQLDLALAADVSARHVSFLETGRAAPSREMVLRLGSALRMPLRDQNEMLRAAGHQAAFEEPGLADGLGPAVSQAIDRMLAQHEPYPMVVLDHSYDLLRANQGAMKLITHVVADPSALRPPVNLFRLLFDPALARGAVHDWHRAARTLLSRLHRESLARPNDLRLSELVRSLLRFPDVPASFRQPDFSIPSEPAITLNLRAPIGPMSFLVTVTTFSAPQNVTLEELRIESYFPMDDETRAACARL